MLPSCLIEIAKALSIISRKRGRVDTPFLFLILPEILGVSSFDSSFQPIALSLQYTRGRALLCFLTVSEPGSHKGAPLSLDSSESPQDEDRVPERTGSCSLESAAPLIYGFSQAFFSAHTQPLWTLWCWISEPHLDKSRGPFFLFGCISDPGP